MLDKMSHPFDVWGNPLNASCTKHFARTRKDDHAAKQTICDDRLEHIQLKLTGFSRKGDGNIAAYDVEAHLIHDFGNYRVHLARHDRRSGLHRRKIDLPESGPGSGAQETQIVADLGQLHGATLENT